MTEGDSGEERQHERPRGSEEDASGQRVCAVVVTHDRLALLRECLAALRRQVRRVDAILVVDNASTDGTGTALRTEFPEVEVLTLAENSGGAGGFHAGMRRAHEEGFDWLWLMDDDTVVEPTALAELLVACEPPPDQRPLVLASRVEWVDGSLHPMNAPLPRTEDPAVLMEACRRGLVPIRAASFVSLLVHRSAVDRYGLPHAHYFIYNDDTEFTARVLRRERGYLVPDSVARHLTATARLSYETTGGRFYYDVRNTLYMLRGSAWSTSEKARIAWDLLHNLKEHLRRNGFGPRPLALVARAVRDGLSPVRSGSRRDGRRWRR